MKYYFVCCIYLISVSLIVVKADDFRLGILQQVQSITYLNYTSAYNGLVNCFRMHENENDSNESHQLAAMAYRYLQSAQGFTLPEHMQNMFFTKDNEYMSHNLNQCASRSSHDPIYSVDKAPIVATDEEDLQREFLMHVSLALWPRNEMV